MYGEVPTSSLVPPVIATGTAAMLPMTGADTVMSLAIAAGAGLVTWGVVYLYTVKFKSFIG